MEAAADTDLGSGSTGAHHRLLKFSKDVEEAGQDEEALEERFAYYNRADADNVVSTEAIPTQGLQPSLMDPKMWMIRTKPGKEKEAILHMMNRFFLKRELGETIHVFSVIAPEHTKGFIFVEADKEPSVRAAIHGIPNVFSSNSTLVPIAQMTSVLRVSNETTDVQVGQWVRMKRSKYVGDLGKVVEIDPSGQRLEIKFIPRIDTAKLLEERQKASAAGRKRGRQKVDLANRAKQRPFNADELTAMDEVVRMEEFDPNTQTQFLSWMNDRYDERGYMYKWWNIKGLELQNVRPTLDELQMFHARDGAEDTEMTAEQKMMRLAKQAQSERGSTVSFAKNDVVRVTEGGEEGLTGKVQHVSGNIVTVLLDAGGGGTQIVEQYESRALEKHFHVGDHIKVLAGVHKGETGLVSNVVDNVVWVVDDSTLQTFHVLKTDVQKSVSVATGQLKLGNYSLHDMVRLQSLRIVGVIVKIDKDQFRILDQNGEMHTVPHPAMGAKVHSRDPVSFDKEHSSVTQGDLLKVVEGPYRGKQGKVIHIYRFYAFLECREVLAHNGIINVKTDHCLLLGNTNRRRRDTNFSALGPNPLMSPGNLKQQMGGAQVDVVTKVYSKSKKKDDIIGKRGTIIKGQNKAHTGTVRNAAGDQLTIVLEATRRSVRVQRDQFRIDGQAAPVQMYDSSASGGGFGGGFGWQTPLHQGAMGTPMRPMTPGVTATPVRGEDDDVWNPLHQTPVHSTQWNLNDDVGMDTSAAGGGSSVDPESRGWTPSSGAGDYNYGASSYSAAQYTPGGGAYDTRTPGAGASPYALSTPGAYTPGQTGYSPAAQASPYGAYGMQASPNVAAAGASPTPYGSSPYHPTPGGQNFGPGGTPTHSGYTPAPGTVNPQSPMPGGAGPVALVMPAHWQHLGAVVRLHSDQALAVVAGLGGGGGEAIDVEVAGTGERRSVPRALMDPVKPEVQDRVVVLAGPHTGQHGELTAVDRTGEALVKLTGNMTLVAIGFLCKST